MGNNFFILKQRLFIFFCSVFFIFGVHTSDAFASDEYEPDNSMETAKVIVIDDPDPQTHRFHEQNDEDWVTFYGIGGQVYNIKVNELSLVCHPSIEIYNESDMLEEFKVDNPGEPVVLKNWICPTEGFYHVKVKNETPTIFGDDVEYRLEIASSIAPTFGFVTGSIIADGSPVSEAWVMTDGNGSAVSLPNGMFTMIHSPGYFSMTVGKSGYEPCQFSIHITEDDDCETNISLSDCSSTSNPTPTPVNPTPTPTPTPTPSPNEGGGGGGGGGGGCFIDAVGTYFDF